MIHLKGKGSAPGIAQGTVVVLRKAAAAAPKNEAPADPSEELKRFEAACVQCVGQTAELYEDLLGRLGEEDAKIVKAYRMLLEDPSFLSPIRKEIGLGTAADQAVESQVEKLSGVFSAMKTDYMRQRADDIRHVGSMLIQALRGGGEFRLPEKQSILVAEDLSPVDTLRLDRNYLAGIVTQFGGKTSHTVILAKTIGIPAITGVPDVLEAFSGAETAVIDGKTGDVYLDPDEATAEHYRERIARERLLTRKIRESNHTKGVTLDGAEIQICANVGGAQDMKPLEKLAYDGIGLFRTEFVFSRFPRYPTFEEQLAAYGEVVKKAEGRPVIIRTLDVGGDKALAYFGLPKEENPFLGYRAVRVCLDREPVFLDQLMAILAAGAMGKAKIMFPMITEMRELAACKRLVEKAKGMLRERGIPFDADMPVGIMVETPASAVLADRFASACDFVSIGTNDLTQYVTCTDRTNPNVQRLYNPYNPAVIRLIGNTLRAARRAGTEAGVCGELAGDLNFLPLLVGFGVGKLSMSPALIEKARYLVCRLDQGELSRLADRVLDLDDPDEIEALVSGISERALGA